MFGLFKSAKARQLKKLEKKYNALLEEAFHLSHRDRAAAAKKEAEAQAVQQQIEALTQEG